MTFYYYWYMCERRIRPLFYCILLTIVSCYKQGWHVKLELSREHRAQFLCWQTDGSGQNWSLYPLVVINKYHDFVLPSSDLILMCIIITNYFAMATKTEQKHLTIEANSCNYTWWHVSLLFLTQSSWRCQMISCLFKTLSSLFIPIYFT